jgi:hypothetical protein
MKPNNSEVGRFLVKILGGLRNAAVISPVLLAIAGCTALPRTPYSASEAATSRVLDVNGLRRYTDEPISKFEVAKSGPAATTYLALSGGGADGAYGVGVLNGWTATGTRPTFSVVSGVSTGGLIAPFAFLGPQYDDVLRELYTSGIAESLLEDSNPLRVLFGSGLAGNTRLRELVARYIGTDLIQAVAREYARGRRLLIVTTDLDTQRTVIWDMGRIATIGTADALNLFRDVMTASASIPMVFPPMLIEAEARGRPFQEMHVDGGVTAPVLTLPDMFLLQGRGLPKGQHLDIFILINNKIERDFELVRNASLDVASRSIESMTKAQTRSIVFSTYKFARHNHLGFHLSYIEREYPSSTSAGFDTAYMRALYQYGYERAATGHAWSTTPPLAKPQ